MAKFNNTVSAPTDKIGECKVMLYSKMTSNGNKVFTGSFTDDKCGRTFYLRSALDTVESKKYQGKECCIINVSVYKSK